MILRSKPYLLFYYLIILNSCTNQSESISNKNLVNENDSLIKYDFNIEDTVLTFPGENNHSIKLLYTFEKKGVEYSPSLEPVAQDLNIEGPKLVRIYEDEDSWTALKRIFNAKDNVVYDGEDSIAVITWQCSTCKVDSILFHEYIDDRVAFPDSSFNLTYLKGDYSFEIYNKKYRLLTFATQLGEFGISFTGRFNAPLSGYALFESNTRGTLNLVQYNMNVGYFGSFNNAFEPEIRIAFGHLFLIYSCCNGGPGGPYTCHNKIILIENGQEYLLPDLQFLSLSNTMIGEWDSRFQFVEENNSININIITEGWGDTNNPIYEEESYIFENAPKEFKDRIKQFKEPFSFVMERVYKLNGDTFELSETKLRTKKLIVLK